MKFILAGLFLLIALVPGKTKGKVYLIETEGNNKKPGEIEISHSDVEKKKKYQDYTGEFEEFPSAFGVGNLGMNSVKSEEKEEEEKQTTTASYNSVQTDATTTTTTTTTTTHPLTSQEATQTTTASYNSVQTDATTTTTTTTTTTHPLTSQEAKQTTTAYYNSIQTDATTTTTTITTTNHPLTSQNETEKRYEETKKEKHTTDEENEVNKEFAFKCEQGVSTNCGQDGKCIISCGDGKKFEMTCPNNGSINSISNNNGLARIGCGKKVEFPPCFPFCNKDNPQLSSGINIGNIGNIGGSSKTSHQAPTFKPCFPFCNNNGVGQNQQSKPFNSNTMFKPCFPFCNT